MSVIHVFMVACVSRALTVISVTVLRAGLAEIVTRLWTLVLLVDGSHVKLNAIASSRIIIASK